MHQGPTENRLGVSWAPSINIIIIIIIIIIITITQNRTQRKCFFLIMSYFALLPK